MNKNTINLFNRFTNITEKEEINQIFNWNLDFKKVSDKIQNTKNFFKTTIVAILPLTISSVLLFSTQALLQKEKSQSAFVTNDTWISSLSSISTKPIFTQEDEKRLDELLEIDEDSLTNVQWDELAFLSFNKIQSIKFTQEDEKRLDELLEISEYKLTNAQWDELVFLEAKKHDYLLAVIRAKRARVKAYIARQNKIVAKQEKQLKFPNQYKAY